MAKAFTELGFNGTKDEKKIHPRDFFHPGRITVEFYQIENGQKTPLNSQIKSRKQFYIAVAEKIKQIREKRQEEKDAKKGKKR